ncbi:DUF1833 family protein [Pseudomonas denitrificans (nom. rej.)]|nr:DUF1833 family protein [Pseudomonas denitrificans (nom. rej.)]
MNPLEVAFASPGTEVLIPCVEIASDAWSSPILLTHGFEDITATTEDGRTLTFKAGGIDVAMPKKDNTGAQTVTFAIDGVSGEAQNLIQAAIDAERRIRLTLRLYLSTDLSKPSQRPYYMTVRSGTLETDHVEPQAGYFDMIGTKWPRDNYNSDSFPCIKYV